MSRPEYRIVGYYPIFIYRDRREKVLPEQLWNGVPELFRSKPSALRWGKAHAPETTVARVRSYRMRFHG